MNVVEVFLLSVVLGSTMAIVALYFQLDRMKLKFDALAVETRTALRDMTQQLIGHKDHIHSVRLDVNANQKEIADFTKDLDPDVIEKFKDRLSVCEMAIGVRRLDTIKSTTKS